MQVRSGLRFRSYVLCTWDAWPNASGLNQILRIYFDFNVAFDRLYTFGGAGIG